MVVGFVIK